VNRQSPARPWFISLLAVTAVLGGASAVTSPALAQAAASPAPDFGSPPSGELPILFNDRHLY